MLNFLDTTAHLNEILPGKCVAVVDNALSLFEQQYGKDIDSHDIVVRINLGGPLCFNLYNDMNNTQIRETMSKFYGHKWCIEKDINNNTIPASHGTKTDIWVLGKVDSEYARIYNNYKKYIKCIINVIDPKIFHKNAHTAKPNSEYFVYNENIEFLKKELNGSIPSTGLKTLDFLRRFSCKSINVYGFDWKKSPTFYDQILKSITKEPKFTVTTRRKNIVKC